MYMNAETITYQVAPKATAMGIDWVTIEVEIECRDVVRGCWFDRVIVSARSKVSVEVFDAFAQWLQERGCALTLKEAN